jgi:sulfite exporter TauE/SafE
MCGGFALMLGSHAHGAWRNALRQSVYACGRISVYVLAGAFVGYGAWQLGRASAAIVNVQGILSLVAGLFLIAEGIFSAGLAPRPFAAKHGCPGANVFATLLRSPHLSTVFVAGLVNGLLPCGLVYAYLALAASAGNLFSGAAVMGLFGLGTMPALVLTGLTGSLLTQIWRVRLFRLAAWCMILTGALTLWRGVAALQSGGEDPACPYCSETTS